jgi:biopolymer transport protein ExbD
MKYMLEVSLVALTLVEAVTSSPSKQSSPEIPTLQPGIRVEMAATSTAKPVPDADQLDAFVLTVTDRGSVYEGTNAIAASELTQEINHRFAARQQQLYIKADARTPYANVSRVLQAAQASGIESPILLTAQQGVAAAPGTITPPEGIEFSLTSNAQSNSASAVVEIFNSAAGPRLKINHQETPWASLETALGHLSQNPSRKVLVNADGETPFAQVVRVIDACRSSGAKVVLTSE